jgi:enamine deaminase RidA (YjgF/YER057c/UK114 family)
MDAEHTIVAPAGLAPAVGFSHGIVSRGARLVWLAGQNDHDEGGRIRAPGDLAAQLDGALANLLAVLDAAGGRPTDLVKLTLYVTDVEAYRASRPALGAVWRGRLGRHYPAMALLGVAAFFDAEALVEVEGVAVLGG